jgi:hypothetical protein
MKNLKNVPEIILKSRCIGHRIDFKWSKKKMENLLDPLKGNEELENALAQIGHKASVGLTAALLEWVHWRFTGYTKAANDMEKRIEALWCSINNPEYSKPLDFDTDLNMPVRSCVNGPVWLALMAAKMVDVRYRKGSYFLQSEIIGLVLLARHTSPKKKVFDKWFTNIIMELTRLFPCQYQYKDIDETDEAIYDSSNEPVISREFFFDTKFKYSVDEAEKAMNNFIHNLDQKANPFLQIREMAY